MRPMPTSSYCHGTYDIPLLGRTIGEDLEAVVARFGARDAVVSRPQGVRLTYAAPWGLLAAGIEKGERAGIWARNCVEWVLVQYATAKIGAILVNINPAYRTHELEYVLNQSGITVLVAARSFKTADYAAMIEEVRPRCPVLRQVVLIGSAEWDALVA